MDEKDPVETGLARLQVRVVQVPDAQGRERERDQQHRAGEHEMEIRAGQVGQLRPERFQAALVVLDNDPKIRGVQGVVVAVAVVVVAVGWRGLALYVWRYES